MIFNGGEPLPGCPENFEEANKWTDNANKDKDEFHEPKWSFDCGFKLDFDGPIIDISSRFYPPKKHYGEGWDGTITVLLMGNEPIKNVLLINKVVFMAANNDRDSTSYVRELDLEIIDYELFHIVNNETKDYQPCLTDFEDRARKGKKGKYLKDWE